MIRYSIACGSYQDFLDRGLLLTMKLLNQGFFLAKLKSSLRKFYGRHPDLDDRCGISVSQITTDTFHFPVFYSFTTYYRVCSQINTTGATSGAGTAYPSGVPEFTPGFQWCSCYSIFWSLCCLFLLDIRIMIAPLVSSNFFYRVRWRRDHSVPPYVILLYYQNHMCSDVKHIKYIFSTKEVKI